eukprot:1180727-Prorocentrum_minimum.AAC.2
MAYVTLMGKWRTRLSLTMDGYIYITGIQLAYEKYGTTEVMSAFKMLIASCGPNLLLDAALRSFASIKL